MAANNQDKGGYAEELARLYFNRSGHFAIRGSKQSYGGHSVTDIDLWAYSKGGINRNITLVDIKNKQRPEAFERILWITGLRQANNAHHTMIITTDRRQEVVDFGKKLNVDVITVNNLKNWYSNSNDLDDYLTEDDFVTNIKLYKYYKTDSDWMSRFESLKTIMVSELGFTSAIVCLDHAHFFLQRAIEIEHQDSLPLRLFFRAVAYFCISIDFVIAKKSILSKDQLEEDLRIGLNFGPSGRDGLEDQLLSLRNLLNGYDDDGLRIFNSVRKNLYSSLENSRLQIISEILAKSSIHQNLFRLAQIFDISSRTIKMSTKTEVIDAVVVLSMLADYWQIERSKIRFAIGIFQPLGPTIQ